MLLDPHEDPLLLDMRGKALEALETARVPPKGKTADPGPQRTEPPPTLASTSLSEPTDMGPRKINRMGRTLLDVGDKARMAFETPKTPTGKDTTSSDSDDDDIDDPSGKPRIIWIALMGAGGAGKTTFISHLVDQPVQVEHGLRSRMWYTHLHLQLKLTLRGRHRRGDPLHASAKRQTRQPCRYPWARR
jgi:hypothetical protein